MLCCTGKIEPSHQTARPGGGGGGGGGACWGRGEQLHYRSIKGSVVITAEAVSLTSRLHYLVSFVAASAERLIE